MDVVLKGSHTMWVAPLVILATQRQTPLDYEDIIAERVYIEIT